MKKGMVYTISIFLLVAVLLSLMAFWVEQTDKRRQTVGGWADEDVLAARLDELGWLSMQALGINATLLRDSTQIQLNVHDAGLPLSLSSAGQVDLLPLKTWLEENWTAVTKTNLTYNFTGMNSSGQLMKTDSGLIYTHDNSNAEYDKVILFIPGASGTPKNVTIDISCAKPGNANLVSYTDWNADGGTLGGRIRYWDDLGGAHTSADDFDPVNSNSFAARFERGENWMGTVHVDWSGGADYSLSVWGDYNTTIAPPLGKNDMRCAFNASLILDRSGAAEESLYLPISTSLRYYNASYGGWLVLARK